MSAIKDAYSNRIVGYSMAPRMKSSLAVAALDNAVRMRGAHPGCVVHSDRGSQFRSRKYQRRLKAYGLVGSMGRVGSAGDNAAMESFFALLQKNVQALARGPPGTNYGSRSPPGSNEPTTGVVENLPWGA